MVDPANSGDANRRAKEAVAIDLAASGQSPAAAEAKLLDLADQIEQQLQKCRDLSEWVLARLDEVEAQYPPLPQGMRTIRQVLEEVGIFSPVGEAAALDREAAQKKSKLLAGLENLEKGARNIQNQLFRFASDTSGHPGYNHGALRFFNKNHRSPLLGSKSDSAFNEWLQISRAIDEREGVPEILQKEQAEWDQLDNLIQSALKIPATSLAALQAKVRIITASNSAQSEISFGDTIDDVLTENLMHHLARAQMPKSDDEKN